MFRSLFQDHLQGSSFALSAPTTLQLQASSYVCIGMWSDALCLYLYPVYLLPVCCLVVSRPDSTQAAGTLYTNTNRGHTTTYQYRHMTKRAAEAW
jgi:hypothetical protein